VPLIAAALARDPADRPSASWLSAQASALEPPPDGSRPTAVGTGSLFPATEDAAAAPAIAYLFRPTPLAAGTAGIAALEALSSFAVPS